MEADRDAVPAGLAFQHSLLQLWHVMKDLHQYMFSHWEINHDKFASRVLCQLPTHNVPGAKRNPTTTAKSKAFFVAGALCLSADHHFETLVYYVTIAAPYPGGIDPRLAVYARS